MISAFSSVLTVVVLLITLGQATAFLPHLISTKQSSNLAMGFFDDLKQKIVAKSAGDYDVPAVSAKLDSIVKSSADGVVMMTFLTCPYCVKAREVLNANNIPFEDIILEDLENGALKGPLRAEMGKRYQQTSVPAIFLKEEFIGGANNGGKGGLIPLLATGELQKML
ncbi:hypothetical protein TrLO_g2708 [Triparma laevis f. longispina]|uniref:Glutaredoxin domain-containing protein n=2 Tax=Triparma laevis TaxID=1534972 RepID=A0A9W7DMB7_9STRA|nr:hypothetical protein TrLO_g2708 [Triparma laevis f. longispina]